MKCIHQIYPRHRIDHYGQNSTTCVKKKCSSGYKCILTYEAMTHDHVRTRPQTRCICEVNQLNKLCSESQHPKTKKPVYGHVGRKCLLHVSAQPSQLICVIHCPVFTQISRDHTMHQPAIQLAHWGGLDETTGHKTEEPHAMFEQMDLFQSCLRKNFCTFHVLCLSMQLPQKVNHFICTIHPAHCHSCIACYVFGMNKTGTDTVGWSVGPRTLVVLGLPQTYYNLYFFLQ